ncbi:MAG: hypothetical protein GXP19_01315, partial [Gammaproteobacteria bacterium]|nr:hypothetical protein [Gammaproteobacteria bacterium]
MLTLTDMDVQPSQLQHKGRSNNVSDAKGLICYWGIYVLGISSTKIARFLEISQPAVSKSSKRGADYCLRNGFR